MDDLVEDMAKHLRRYLGTQRQGRTGRLMSRQFITNGSKVKHRQKAGHGIRGYYKKFDRNAGLLIATPGNAAASANLNVPGRCHAITI